MSEEEMKFLEIVDLKKGFGCGETRQEVLRGMNFTVAKGELRLFALFCIMKGLEICTLSLCASISSTLEIHTIHQPPCQKTTKMSYPFKNC